MRTWSRAGPGEGSCAAREEANIVDLLKTKPSYKRRPCCVVVVVVSGVVANEAKAEQQLRPEQFAANWESFVRYRGVRNRRREGRGGE